jgi:hypothetical protein
MMDIPFDEQQQHSNPKCHDAAVAAIHFMLWMFQTWIFTPASLQREQLLARFRGHHSPIRLIFMCLGVYLGDRFFCGAQDPCDW